MEVREIWVPANFIIETSLECESAKIIQKEARYRLKEGSRIKVFSRSEELTKWVNIGENRDYPQLLITIFGHTPYLP